MPRHVRSPPRAGGSPFGHPAQRSLSSMRRLTPILRWIAEPFCPHAQQRRDRADAGAHLNRFDLTAVTRISQSNSDEHQSRAGPSGAAALRWRVISAIRCAFLLVQVRPQIPHSSFSQETVGAGDGLGQGVGTISPF